MLARSIALEFSYATDGSTLPKWYEWAPSFLPKPENERLRFTDLDDGGYVGAKWLQGCVIEADTAGIPVTVEVRDENNVVISTLTLNHSGQQQKPYSWPPVVTHLMRLVPTTSQEFRLHQVRWVWEPHPEATTHWWSQVTSHGFPGYQHVRDAFIAYESTGPVTFEVVVDGVSYAYALPTTAGAYAKIYVPLRAIKGKSFQYRLTAEVGAALRVFLKDLEFRVKPWGTGLPYQTVRLLGDVTVEQGGARI